MQEGNQTREDYKLSFLRRNISRAHSRWWRWSGGVLVDVGVDTIVEEENEQLK